MSRFSATIVNSGLQSSVSNEHGIQTVDTEGSPVPGTPSSAAVASRKLRAVSTVCVPANSPAPEVDIPAILTPPSCTVTALAFSRDSEWVASGSSDGMITLRKVDNPDNKTQLAADTSQIYALAFSPKGERLASAHKSGEIKSGSNVNLNGPPSHMAPSPSSSSLRTAVYSYLEETTIAHTYGISMMPKPQVVLHTADTQRKLLHASFDPNSKHIITCSSNHTVRMWDSNTGDLRTVDEAFK
ncbi:hypothetical protein TRAPUB_1325, partial [Trametes pubescens]